MTFIVVRSTLYNGLVALRNFVLKCVVSSILSMNIVRFGSFFNYLCNGQVSSVLFTPSHMFFKERSLLRYSGVYCTWKICGLICDVIF